MWIMSSDYDQPILECILKTDVSVLGLFSLRNYIETVQKKDIIFNTYTLPLGDLYNKIALRVFARFHLLGNAVSACNLISIMFEFF